VTPIRKFCLLSVLVCGCAASAPLETRTGAEIKRKPDGVLLEPSPAVPVAVEHADARGVVALKMPLSIDDVKAVVAELMKGYENEAIEKIMVMLLPDAVDPFKHLNLQQIRAEINSRFQHLEFQKMRGLEVAHVDRAELREYDDLMTSGPRPRPPEMTPGDIWVRIPMTAPLSQGERLFDDYLVLILRRDARDPKSALKIAAIGETN
jgi:hypothetical protein